MTVKSIAEVNKRAGMCLIQFEDGSDVIASVMQVADFGLFAGRVLSDDEHTELLEGIKRSTAKVRAVRMLGSRSYSADEIKKKLIGKGDSMLVAQEAVEWLEETGLINDGQYARAIVKHYGAKAYGQARVKDELYKRGISRELWEDALCEFDESAMQAAIEEYLWKRLKGSSDKGDLRKAVDALVRRGYCYEQAKSAVSRYIEGLENTDEH